MKFKFLSTREFILVYLLVMLLDLIFPIFLPEKIVGPYLFWTLLTLIVIIYSFFKLKGRTK